jgi:hypothetical protein
MYFDLTWKDDKLEYEILGINIKESTLITQQGIKDYFELIDECLKEKVVPPRVADIDSLGKDIPFNQCKYCVFQQACDLVENNYQDWIDYCKSLTKGE